MGRVHSLGSGEASLYGTVRPGGAAERWAGRVLGNGNRAEGAERAREGSTGRGGANVRGEEAHQRSRGQVQKERTL